MKKKYAWLFLGAAFLAMTAAEAPGQETIEKHAKIVILFDVSASMNTIDGPAIPGRDSATLPSRQDHVLQFLSGKLPPALKGNKADAPFLEQLLKKAPVTAYRFGAALDELDVAHFQDGKTWTSDQWARWLKSDSSAADPHAGANIARSALQMLHREKDNYLQAILIFSDGRSNRTTREEMDAFLAAVQEAKGPLPVFTIGVGEFVPLPAIRLGALNAPQVVRPDDKFPVRVPVHGAGLTGEEFQVVLEAQRITDAAGRAVPREKRYLPGPKVGKFKGAEATPIDFDIDLRSLKKNAGAELEGTWQFTARVASHPREAFAGTEHVSEPVRVSVQNRRLRVLLFAGAATREFLFLRAILQREMTEKRIEMSICLQSGREGLLDQDIEPERLLADFPNKLGPNDAGQRFRSLSDYDVIAAFDPDWTKLSVKQRKLLKDWVGTHAGGIIFVAGPVYTYQLARPGGQDFSSLLAIQPVVLKDSRLHGLGPGGHDATRPHALNFTPLAKEYPFLKLDDAGASPTAGWNGFFWNNEKYQAEPGKYLRPIRGFFTCYPVERLKPASHVVATFVGPRESRIGEKTDDFKDQQPFIVAMPYGAGRSLHLGSGEFWRLRSYKHGFHERFWLNMIRYVADGAVRRRPPGQILMSRSASAGEIRVEAQILGKDSKPLPQGHEPTVQVRKLSDDVAMPDSAEWFMLRPDTEKAGWFAGVISIREPGEYVVQIAVPGGAETLSDRLTVRPGTGDPDDVRVDFGKLYQLASKAEPLLRKLPADTRADIEALLRQSAKFPDAPASQDVPWLFFHLFAADAIPACLEKLPPKKFAKVDPPKTEKDPKSLFKEKKTVKVLVIDGEGVRGRKEGGDSFFIERAIVAIPGKAYEVVFGDDLPDTRPDAARALERDDLAKFGAVLLLNVPKLNAKQVANLEKYSKAGGGVAFFLGPNVSSDSYNKDLFKAGKGLFPVPLEKSFFPLHDKKDLEVNEDSELQLRDDLFPDLNRYPIFGELSDFPGLREVLKNLSIHRYFKVPRAAWRPEPGRSFELATLANAASSTIFDARVGEITRGELSNKVLERKEYKEYRPGLERHLRNLEDLVRPGADKKSLHLVKAIDDMLLDRGMKELWKNPDPRIRSLLEAVARLRQQVRYGDPLMVGGHFGKGRVVAVLTTAGKQWNDFGGGGPASIVYAPFIWETLNYLTGQQRRAPSLPQPGSGKAYPPQLIGIDLAYAARKPRGKDLPPELSEAVLVTPDVLLPFRGRLADDTGLSKAHWVVQVQQVEFVAGKFSKLLAPRPEQMFPLGAFQAKQEKRAHDEFLRNILSGAKDLSYPSGFFRTHFLEEETGFDFQKHLPQLKAKKDELQKHYLVRLWFSAASSNPQAGTSRSAKPFLFLVVSEIEWLNQAFHAGDKVYERLESAQEKLHDAQNSFDGQTAKLRHPDANLSLAALRVAEIRTSLQSSAGHTREAAQGVGRIAHESEINRVPKDLLDRVTKIVRSLHLLLDRGDKDFGKADASLHHLSALLEKGKKETLLKQVREVRENLKGLDKNLTQSMEMVSEWIVEAKLIELLQKIEMSRPSHRDLQRENMERLIERLLQKSPEKKK